MPNGTYIVVSMAVAFATSLSPNSSAQSASPLSISVDSGRPVADAIEELERRYGWPITYEDPPFSFSGDLRDVTKQVRKDYTPGATKVLVPRGGRLAFRYALDGSESQRAHSVLQTLLQAYRTAGGQTSYHVLRGDGVQHVVPTAVRDVTGSRHDLGPVLSARISFPLMERTVLQTVEAIIEAASAKTGETVLTGSVPQGPLNVRKTTLGADNEVAREVLVRALRSTGYTLSWQLFYSASPGPAYYLNLHFVRPVE